MATYHRNGPVSTLLWTPFMLLLSPIIVPIALTVYWNRKRVRTGLLVTKETINGMPAGYNQRVKVQRGKYYMTAEPDWTRKYAHVEVDTNAKGEQREAFSEAIRSAYGNMQRIDHESEQIRTVLGW